LLAPDWRHYRDMSDHGPEEPFEPEREDEQREEKTEDEVERKPETLRNPWAKTSSGDA